MVRTKPTIPGIVDRERWAWEQGVKHNLDYLARLVLLRIVYRAGGPDGCFESQAELGKHVGCSRQHVNLHVLPELEALALIVRDGRKRRAAVYHPIVNLMPQSIPAPQLRSVKPRVDKTIEPKCQVQTLQDHVKPRVDTNKKEEEFLGATGPGRLSNGSAPLLETEHHLSNISPSLPDSEPANGKGSGIDDEMGDIYEVVSVNGNTDSESFGGLAEGDGEKAIEERRAPSEQPTQRLGGAPCKAQGRHSG